MQAEFPWSYEIELAAVPAEGQLFDLVPDEETRKRLAETVGVVSIPALNVRMEVRPIGIDGAQVTGSLAGTVTQTCVVSLETFDNTIEENFSVDFATDPASEVQADDQEDIEDLPDPIIDGKIDLAALATEFLILAIDPYPRKPGAELSLPPVEEAMPEPSRSPFEQLSGLKSKIKKDL